MKFEHNHAIINKYALYNKQIVIHACNEVLIIKFKLNYRRAALEINSSSGLLTMFISLFVYYLIKEFLLYSLVGFSTEHQVDLNFQDQNNIIRFLHLKFKLDARYELDGNLGKTPFSNNFISNNEETMYQGVQTFMYGMNLSNLSK